MTEKKKHEINLNSKNNWRINKHLLENDKNVITCQHKSMSFSNAIFIKFMTPHESDPNYFIYHIFLMHLLNPN